MIENVVEKKDCKYEKSTAKSLFLSHNSYNIPQTILSIFLYLTFSFQHIKHNYNDLNTIYSNVKRPNDDSSKKMHLFDL